MRATSRRQYIFRTYAFAARLSAARCCYRMTASPLGTRDRAFAQEVGSSAPCSFSYASIAQPQGRNVRG